MLLLLLRAVNSDPDVRVNHLLLVLRLGCNAKRRAGALRGI
ncbi:hypothetical protein OAI26_06085 [Sulfitobacter sp.]|nr:hypothetical protein [Sulfitobacter sp.]